MAHTMHRLGSHPKHWDEPPALSERSRKFYDGTYRMVGEGFIDEHGAYRDFDYTGENPEAAVPTPRPTSPFSDSGPDTSTSVEPAEAPFGTQASLQQDQDSIPDPRTTARDLLSSVFIQKTDDPNVYNFISIPNGATYEMTILREDLFPGHPDRERLLGRLEGILIGYWHGSTEKLSLEECYRLCDVSVPDEVLNTASAEWSARKVISSNIFMKDTGAESQHPESVDASDSISPLQSASNDEKGAEATWSEESTMASQARLEAKMSPWSATEESLSDCPSDLSDWDIELKKSNTSAGQAKTDPNHKKEESVVGTQKKGTPKIKAKAKKAGGNGTRKDSGIADVQTRRSSVRQFQNDEKVQK